MILRVFGLIFPTLLRWFHLHDRWRIPQVELHDLKLEDLKVSAHEATVFFFRKKRELSVEQVGLSGNLKILM